MIGTQKFLLRATFYKSISLGFPHLLSRMLCELTCITFVARDNVSISSCPELFADNNIFLYNVMRVFDETCVESFKRQDKGFLKLDIVLNDRLFVIVANTIFIKNN